MWWPLQWLVIYVIGGITFVPLLIAALIYYVLTYGSVPVGDDDLNKLKKARLQREEERDEQVEKSKSVGATGKPLAGWLTIRRQFAPAARPSSLFSTVPTTDFAGAEIEKEGEDEDRAQGESSEKEKGAEAGMEGSGTFNGTGERSSTPSTYSARIAQTYRQMMEARQKKDAPPKEYFYCVLKGSVLFLYEDEEQSDCVAAIGVDKYIVIVEKTETEGQNWLGKDAEMFAKRNAIVLRIAEGGKLGGQGKKGLPILAKGMADGEAGMKEESQEMENAPWYLFSKSNTKMEDWYLALLQVSVVRPTTTDVFSTADMRALVDTIDTEPDPIPMRWFNAMFGRVFFGLYRTAALEEFIIAKIMKKLSKVPRPSFLGPIVVREVNVGTFPPLFSKPMLKDLTAEGTAAFEVHMAYRCQPSRPNSEVRITIATTATIPTGFKPYVVDLVLAVVLKSIEGNMVLQIKKPPSNRVWYGFTHPPKMEVEILPIVSERKIQIGMVLKAIERQMREVIAESVVLPNMDDIAFFDTSALEIRGGIFSEAGKLNAAETAEETVMPRKPATDVMTSAEDPSSATPETATVRNRRPTSPHTMDSNGVAVSTGTDKDEVMPSQGLPRTETAPAGLATGPMTKKTASIQATKKWFAQGNRSATLSVQSLSEAPKTQSRESLIRRTGSQSSGKSGILTEGLTSEPNVATTEIAPIAVSTSSADTSSGGQKSSIASSSAQDPSPPHSGSVSFHSLGRSVGISDTSIASDTTATSRDTSASTSTLISSLRTGDKKAIQSQVNMARDNLKKGWATFAAKRRAGLKGQLDEREEAKSAALYRPPEEEADREAEAVPGARRSGEYKSLKERLDAAAHGTSTGPLIIPSRQRSNTASSKESTMSKPSLLSSPSRTGSAQADLSTTPPQWTLSTGRPTTEVHKDPAAGSSLSSTPPKVLEPHLNGHQARKPSTGNAPVMLQPSAGRSMVVPRVPKRPGEVTGLGSHPVQGITRRVSVEDESRKQKNGGGGTEKPGRMGSSLPPPSLPPPLPQRGSLEERPQSSETAIPPPLPARNASPDVGQAGRSRDDTGSSVNGKIASSNASDARPTSCAPHHVTSGEEETVIPGLSHPPSDLATAIEADLAVQPLAADEDATPPPSHDLAVTKRISPADIGLPESHEGSKEDLLESEDEGMLNGELKGPGQKTQNGLNVAKPANGSSAEDALRKVVKRDDAVRAQAQPGGQDETDRS